MPHQGELPEGKGGPRGEPAVAEAAAVLVEDAQHLRGNGQGAARSAHEQALLSPPHEDRQGGGEGGIGSPHLQVPGARPGEGIGD